MSSKSNITVKLQKIVQQRSTPLIIKKQEINYKPVRSSKTSLASEGYTYYTNEE